MAVLLSQKETWHVYFMNVIFFMNLSINFNSFQEVKKKKKNQLCPRALQFKHHVIFLSYTYGIKLSKCTNPVSFSVTFLIFLVNLPLSSFNVLLQTCDINTAEFKGSFQLLSKKFQIYTYIWQ